VGGTPTARAVALIDDLEGMDRGRYAGPVGWMDASGDGEFAIALRCAEISGARARLFAGAGIVAPGERVGGNEAQIAGNARGPRVSPGLPTGDTAASYPPALSACRTAEPIRPRTSTP
jgi:hypothetical protein